MTWCLNVPPSLAHVRGVQVSHTLADFIVSEAGRTRQAAAAASAVPPGGDGPAAPIRRQKSFAIPRPDPPPDGGDDAARPLPRRRASIGSPGLVEKVRKYATLP